MSIYLPERAESYEELSDDKKRVLNGAYSWWVEESLKLIEESYGITFEEGEKINFYFVDKASDIKRLAGDDDLLERHMNRQQTNLAYSAGYTFWLYFAKQASNIDFPTFGDIIVTGSGNDSINTRSGSDTIPVQVMIISISEANLQ